MGVSFGFDIGNVDKDKAELEAKLSHVRKMRDKRKRAELFNEEQEERKRKGEEPL